MRVAQQQLSLRLDDSTDSAIARRMRAFGRKAKEAADKVTGKKPIEGFVDRVLAGEVQGWAFDPNKPARRVHITARHEGEIIAETLADLPRKDLTRGGKGDGKHGFNLRIPAGFLDGSPRRLRIEAASGRTRVLLRRGEITVATSRPSATARKPRPGAGAGTPSGALEGVANGVLLGWAAQPRSGGAPAVVDIYDDERYLGSVMADRPRPRREDEPRGAKSFHFRLPQDADEQLLRRLRARITGTQQDLKGLRQTESGREPRHSETAPAAPTPAKLVRADMPMGLLVFGPATEEALRRTVRSWNDQSWANLAIGRVVTDSESAGDNVFGPADAARLRAFIAGAEALVVVRAGETLNPDLARTLDRADPLADILTWDLDGAPPRRAEAWALAIQLGQSLESGYAIRTSSLAQLAERLAPAALGGQRAWELALAEQPWRWRHLPAALSSGAASGEVHSAITPPELASLSVAVWPGEAEAVEATLLRLVAALGPCRIEALLAASAPESLIERLRSMGEGRVVARKIDASAAAGTGAQMRAFSEAASGDVVLLCRAGLAPDPGADLMGMARWALAPQAGAVTGPLRWDDGEVAGLGLALSARGWRMTPATLQIGSAPVAAAPAAFMAVSRSKLAAVGGVDAIRFPDTAADIDLCLRLRRMGWFSLAWAQAKAELPGSVLDRDPEAALALLEHGELALLGASYPARDSRRVGSPA